jgi:hypothetical protein
VPAGQAAQPQPQLAFSTRYDDLPDAMRQQLDDVQKKVRAAHPGGAGPRRQLGSGSQLHAMQGGAWPPRAPMGRRAVADCRR